MRFKITRASHRLQATNSPCEGAVLVKTSGEGWNDWEIEINDLDALVAITRREKCPLIIGDDDITIYDDYVE